MELFGTNFAITLGSWRLSFRLAVEDVDAPAMPPKPSANHRVRVVDDPVYHNVGYN